MISRPLRILHVDTERSWRGTEQQLLWLARGLADRGIDTFIACPPGSPLELRARSAGLQVLPVMMRGAVDLRAVATLRHFVRRHSIDVLHAHTPQAQALVALAARGELASRVVTRGLDAAPAGALAHLGNRAGFDRIIATSPAVKAALVGGGTDPRRITVVRPPGLDAALCAGLAARDTARSADRLRAALGLSTHRGPLVGTVTALVAGSGVEHLVEAVPHLLLRHPAARVVVLGDGEGRHLLEHRIDRLGLHDAIVLADVAVQPAELADILAVYVAPVLTTGFDTALAQAMAAGLPVVTSAVAGLTELVDDETTGVLVPPASPRSLAAAIADLLDDPERARRLGEAARSHVRANFPLAAAIAGHVAVYDELALGHAAPAPPTATR